MMSADERMSVLIRWRAGFAKARPMNERGVRLAQDVIETLRIVRELKPGDDLEIHQPVTRAGMRERNCLACGRAFLSAGIGNRLCWEHALKG